MKYEHECKYDTTDKQCIMSQDCRLPEIDDTQANIIGKTKVCIFKPSLLEVQDWDLIIFSHLKSVIYSDLPEIYYKLKEFSKQEDNDLVLNL